MTLRETGQLLYPLPDLTLFSRPVSTTSISVSDFNISMDDAPNLLDAVAQLNDIRKHTTGVGTLRSQLPDMEFWRSQLEISRVSLSHHYILVMAVDSPSSPMAPSMPVEPVFFYKPGCVNPVWVGCYLSADIPYHSFYSILYILRLSPSAP